MTPQLPIPPHFIPSRVDQVWRVPYQERFVDAVGWAKEHEITPAGLDSFKVSLILVDVQNTFCIPDFELFVAGRSGNAAVEDNRRLCEFIYKNLGFLTEISPTLDTHQAIQIFHNIFLLDPGGEHPDPYTLITIKEIESGLWRANPDLASILGVDPQYFDEHLRHYTQTLADRGKYDLTIWPYHAMLGGIGHALVSSVEEAIFFHTVARKSQVDFQIKGDEPFTEHYSALRSEVMNDHFGSTIGSKNEKFIQKLKSFDMVIIAGQAKSHCVAFTISDLLSDIQSIDPALVGKVFLLEDCSSPVVIEGVVDYTDAAEAAFQRFSSAGMHIVKSVDPIEDWPGVKDLAE
jgi:nicotinamidase-related amidase